MRHANHTAYSEPPRPVQFVRLTSTYIFASDFGSASNGEGHRARDRCTVCASIPGRTLGASAIKGPQLYTDGAARYDR